MQCREFSSSFGGRTRRAVILPLLLICHLPLSAQLGPPFGISQGVQNSDPSVSFNSVEETYIVAWKEDSPSFPGAEKILVVVVDDGGSQHSPVTAISASRLDTSPPRVAFDSISGEWLLVWSSGRIPFEGAAPERIHARRIDGEGNVLGQTDRIISGESEEARNPDVASGWYRFGNAEPQPYYLIAWEDSGSGGSVIQAINVFADPGSDDILLSDFGSFTLDDAGELPPSHESFRPRISRRGPLFTQLGDPGMTETTYQVVFESRVGEGVDVLSDVILADVTLNTARALVPVTRTRRRLDSVQDPEIAFNELADRHLVVFRRGSEIRGQLLTATGRSPYHELLAGDFSVDFGDGYALDSAPNDGSFLCLPHLVLGIEGDRIAGQNIMNLYGFTRDTDQPALAVDTTNGRSFLMVYRSLGHGGSQAILARVWTGLLPLLNSSPSAVVTGPEEVVEGTPFTLDGSGSTDRDGDPLIYRWRQLSGLPATFISPTDAPTPSLTAPMLPVGQLEASLQFELSVDDLRSSEPFPSHRRVAVRVVSAGDPNPPVAVAGDDFSAQEDAWVELDGCNSHDPDAGETITYLWTFTGSTPGVTIQNPLINQAMSCNPSFTTPRFAHPGGLDLVFTLRVTSARGASAEDTITVHVADSINEPPVARASAVASVFENTFFLLVGDQSNDDNGDPLTYSWKLLSDLYSSGSLSEDILLTETDEAIAHCEASVFATRTLEFELTVSDGRGGSDTDRVSVQIEAQPLQVDDFYPEFGSPGTRVVILGKGLYTPDLQVYFGGNTIHHLATIEKITDTRVDVIVPTGVPTHRSIFIRKFGTLDLKEYLDIRTGPITVKTPEKTVVTTRSFNVSHHRVQEILFSQGLEAYGLVRGKPSLLQVRTITQEGAPAKLARMTRVICRVTPVGGTSFEIEPRLFPSAAAAPTAQIGAMNEAVNFFIAGSQLDAERYSLEISLYNNSMRVIHAVSLGDSSYFAQTITPRLVIVPVVPFQGGKIAPNFDWAAFRGGWHRAWDAFRRIYPVSDVEFSEFYNYYRMGGLVDDDGLIRLKSFSLSPSFLSNKVPPLVKLRMLLDDWNDKHPQEAAMSIVGLIDSSLDGGGSTRGFGVPPHDMMARIVRFYMTKKIPVLGGIVEFLDKALQTVVCVATFGLWCPDPIEIAVKAVLGTLDLMGIKLGGHASFLFNDFNVGQVLAHEVGHNLGFVDPFAYNSDRDNISHSRFDEGPLGFLDVPDVHDPIFDVIAPGEIYNSANPPKSLMSYAPGKSSSNTFFEPWEYDRLLTRFATSSSTKARQIQRNGDLPDVPFEKMLRLVGGIDLLSRELTVYDSHPTDASSTPSEVLAESPLTIRFLDGAGGVILSEGVAVSIFPKSPVGEIDLADETAFRWAIFSLQRPLPLDARTVELDVLGEVAWSREVSARPPVVSILQPAGGESLAVDAEMDVSWIATDPDGDDLQYSLWLTTDGGSTFTPLDLALRETTWHWATGPAPGAEDARIKVVASDGFKEGGALSAPFRIEPRPLSVFVTDPDPETPLLAGQSVMLSGSGYEPGKGQVKDATLYHWSSSVDGPLGDGRGLVVDGLSPGLHRITLTLDAEAGTASDWVDVEVLPDRDGDGVADDVEAATAGLDPDDPLDVLQDEDGDGLLRGSELLVFATDPSLADSDGDGIPDGQEVSELSNPSSDDSDGDGVRDDLDNCRRIANPGQEDINLDGIGDVCPAPWHYSFKAGVNLIYLPLEDPDLVTAHVLLDRLGGPDRVVSIGRWDPAAGDFITAGWADDGAPVGENFTVPPGEGLLVEAAVDFELELAMPLICPPPVDISGTSMLAGLPCVAEGMTAFEFLASGAGGVGVDRIRRWVPGSGEIEEASLDNGLPDGVDFPLVWQEAYFLESTASVVVEGFTCVPSGTGALELSWEPLAGATGYFLVYGMGEFIELDAATTSTRLEDLEPGIQEFCITGLIEDAPVMDSACCTVDIEAASTETFRRGDADSSGITDISDAIGILSYLFLGGPPPLCMDAADADDRGDLSITDAIFILEYLFLGGRSPPDPGPTNCGLDPSDDGLGCADGGCSA